MIILMTELLFLFINISHSVIKIRDASNGLPTIYGCYYGETSGDI